MTYRQGAVKLKTKHLKAFLSKHPDLREHYFKTLLLPE
jgi:hypothetical protein